MKKIISIIFLCLFPLCCMSQTNHYVSLSGGHISPYTNWITASTTIQASIDVSGTNDIIWVTNGVYETGGVTNYPSGILTNRVSIYKPVKIYSINGPSNTVIKGNWNVITTNGPDAVRCVYIVNGSELHGFTLTRGATLLTDIGLPSSMGGGFYGQGIISNCIITSNSSSYLTPNYGLGTARLYNCEISYNIAQYSFAYGGGIRDGILYNCIVYKNTAKGTLNYGGGVYGGRAYNCLIYSNYTSGSGGGARLSALYNCQILYNTAAQGGAGQSCHCYNCLIVGNTAVLGGVFHEYASIYTNYNCTMVGNTASSHGGIYTSAGITNKLYNCIVYGNMGGGTSNYVPSSCEFKYSNTAPLPSGEGNISVNPGFVNPGSGYGSNHIFGNYRLGEDSYCINSGTNFTWQIVDPLNNLRNEDLDGRQRVRNFIVDMGSYEAWSIEKSILLIRAEDSLPR